MLTKGVIQLNQKYDTALVNIVAFGSFEPINIGPVRSKMVEFRLINKVESSDGLVSVTTASGEVIRVHPDLISDDGLETVKSNSTSRKGRKIKKTVLQPPSDSKGMAYKRNKEGNGACTQKEGSSKVS